MFMAVFTAFYELFYVNPKEFIILNLSRDGVGARLHEIHIKKKFYFEHRKTVEYNQIHGIIAKKPAAVKFSIKKL